MGWKHLGRWGELSKCSFYIISGTLSDSYFKHGGLGPAIFINITSSVIFSQFCDAANLSTIHRKIHSQVWLQDRQEAKMLLESCYFWTTKSKCGGTHLFPPTFSWWNFLFFWVKNLLRGSQPIFRFSKIEKSHIIFLLNLTSTSESLRYWPKYIKCLIRSLIPIPYERKWV